MSRLRIFVSSTCYDLAAVRESLRDHIILLGHEPLLSEYPSFPVNPCETAIENCQKNVKNHCDVFLLIIGGRRGCLDSETGKSVTNLEYEMAHRAGIPCFIFVQRSVGSLFSVWKKNPTADFTPTVDYPEVFGFIERIRSDNRWTFDFEKADEIKQVLSIQLSTMFRSLLERDKAGKLDPLAEFNTEPAKAQQIARGKPRFWEYLLTGELLSTRLAEVRRRYNRVHNGIAYCGSKKVRASDYISKILEKLNDLKRILPALQGQLEMIQAAWGPVGQPGNALEIRQAVNEFIELCNHLVDWESDVRSLIPPEGLNPLTDTMKGWTNIILEEMETFPVQLLEPFRNGAIPTGCIEIRLTLKEPSMDVFNAELEKIQAQPWLICD